MTELIICEKPSAAKKIAEALADTKASKKAYKKVPYYTLRHNKKDIIIASAVGHLYTVAQKGKSGWSYPVFDVEWKPTYQVVKDAAYVKPYVELLGKLCEEAEEFTVACDYDIEGEVIGLNALRYSCKQKDANRMKFSTLTKEDLIHAYENKSKHLDWGQARAGETRHFLDWYYGINLSRALTASVKAANSFKIMSIGRVQGPTLKLITDREKEIKKFIPTPFWQLILEGKELEAMHERDKFLDKKEVTKIFEKIKGEKTGEVKKTEKRTQKQAPPTPFDLTTLQVESFNHFKTTPKETLAAAQHLYLGGFISYPRTSSQVLDPKLNFKKILEHLKRNAKYTQKAEEVLKGSLKPNNGKKTDPAHPAIYPTGIIPQELNPRDNKIYDLIVKRFLAVFGKAAVRESVKVKIDVCSEMFIATGNRTIEPNWHLLYEPYVKLKETELPDLKEGDKIKIKKINMLSKETQPPKRFTQSSLVKELEKHGLGTKATRAEIVDTMLKRGYAEGGPLTATEVGIMTADTLQKFIPEILDEDLTREFEEEMEKIREKEDTEKGILDKAKKHLMFLLDRFSKKEKEIGEELLKTIKKEREENRTIGSCPVCKKGTLKILHNRKTKKQFIGCDKYPECETTFPLPQRVLIKPTEKKCGECGYSVVSVIRGKRKQELCINPKCPSKHHEMKKVDKKCPECGQPLVLRTSFYGEFLGCSGYPKCKHTEKIDKKKEKDTKK